jgi:hypothetical protein
MRRRNRASHANVKTRLRHPSTNYVVPTWITARMLYAHWLPLASSPLNLFSKSNDRPDCLPGDHQFERIVDLFHRQKMGWSNPSASFAPVFDVITCHNHPETGHTNTVYKSSII